VPQNFYKHFLKKQITFFFTGKTFFLLKKTFFTGKTFFLLGKKTFFYLYSGAFLGPQINRFYSGLGPKYFVQLGSFNLVGLVKTFLSGL